jgi:hypothetical protein
VEKHNPMTTDLIEVQSSDRLLSHRPSSTGYEETHRFFLSEQALIYDLPFSKSQMSYTSI